MNKSQGLVSFRGVPVSFTQGAAVTGFSSEDLTLGRDAGEFQRPGRSGAS